MTAPEMTTTTSLADRVWARLAAVLRLLGAPGQAAVHGRRLILEAIVFVMQTGCAWRALPAQFPPWQTVYDQLRRWQEFGVWEAICNKESSANTDSQLRL
jgi:transposase